MRLYEIVKVMIVSRRDRCLEVDLEFDDIKRVGKREGNCKGDW